MYETAAMPYRLFAALLIAVLCHVLVLGILTWPQKPQPSTSPTTLHVKIAASAIQPPTQPADSAPSTGLTPIVTSQESDPAILFQLPEQLPDRAPAFQPPSSDTAWIDTLFSSSTPGLDQDQTAPDQVTQVNTQELPLMSSYQRQLLKVLGRNQYHDSQYAFSRLQQERQVRLQLRLLANGALVRADIMQSSGDPALDQAAQRSAYAASPFPPPPAEDAAQGYTYIIEIRYQPRPQGHP